MHSSKLVAVPPGSSSTSRSSSNSKGVVVSYLWIRRIHLVAGDHVPHQHVGAQLDLAHRVQLWHGGARGGGGGHAVGRQDLVQIHCYNHPSGGGGEREPGGEEDTGTVQEEKLVACARIPESEYCYKG
jgi:hypothetical protein